MRREAQELPVPPGEHERRALLVLLLVQKGEAHGAAPQVEDGGRQEPEPVPTLLRAAHRHQNLKRSEEKEPSPGCRQTKDKAGLFWTAGPMRKQRAELGRAGGWAGGGGVHPAVYPLSSSDGIPRAEWSPWIPTLKIFDLGQMKMLDLRNFTSGKKLVFCGKSRDRLRVPRAFPCLDYIPRRALRFVKSFL